jgi:hypothetical protein
MIVIVVYAECHNQVQMLSVGMLGVVVLCVVVLDVVAPFLPSSSLLKRVSSYFKSFLLAKLVCSLLKCTFAFFIKTQPNMLETAREH